MGMKVFWFVVTVVVGYVVTSALGVLPLLANGMEGTGAETKEWTFWVAWTGCMAVAGCVAAVRRRWDVLAGLVGVALYVLVYYGLGIRFPLGG